MDQLVSQHGPMAAVAVLLAGTIWQALYIARKWVEKKLNGHLTAPPPSTARACAWSPERSHEWQSVVENVSTIKKVQAIQHDQILRGDMKCAFNSRDELRDMIELLREINAGIARLNQAMGK